MDDLIQFFYWYIDKVDIEIFGLIVFWIVIGNRKVIIKSGDWIDYEFFLNVLY